MRIKIVKYEARNSVNIGNINKFRNEAVGDSKLMDAGHNLFRGSVSKLYKVMYLLQRIFSVKYHSNRNASTGRILAAR